MDKQNNQQNNQSSGDDTILYTIPRVVKISQLSSYKYNIVFNQPQELLVQSIVHDQLIENAFSNHLYTTISFFAHSASSLSDYITKQSVTQEQSISILWHLNKQFQFMKSRGWGISCLRTQDIIVIDNSTFVYIHPKYMFPIQNNCLNIPFPLPLDSFVSCELKEMIRLTTLNQNEPPYIVSYTTFYYSLGCMILSLMNKKTDDTTLSLSLSLSLSISSDFSPLELLETFTSIYSSKLYWCLLRMLQSDPTIRTLLFI